jgi:hypothetical protein
VHQQEEVEEVPGALPTAAKMVRARSASLAVIAVFAVLVQSASAQSGRDCGAEGQACCCKGALRWRQQQQLVQVRSWSKWQLGLAQTGSDGF